MKVKFNSYMFGCDPYALKMTLKRLKGCRLASIVSGLVLGAYAVFNPLNSMAQDYVEITSLGGGIQPTIVYNRHTAVGQEGVDGDDSEFLAPFSPYYKISSNQGGRDLGIDARPINSLTLITNILSVVDGPITATNRIRIVVSQRDTNYNYFADASINGAVTVDGQPYTTNLSLDSMTNWVNVPGVTNCNGNYGSIISRRTLIVDLESIVSSAGANGSISPTGTVWVPYGDSTNWNIQASNGYHVYLITTNGAVAVSNNLNSLVSTNFIWNNITGTGTVNAVFDVNKYNLTVNSEHNGTYPGTTNNVAHGTTLDQFITNTPLVDGGLRYLANGGNVLSNSFTQVSPTNINLTLTNNAVLNWLWTTQALFNASITNGNITGATNGWYGLGSNIIVTANPSNTFHFSGWTGDVPLGSETNNPLSLVMDQARNINAVILPESQCLLTVQSVHGMAWPGTIITNNGVTLDQFITNTPVVDGGLRYLANGFNLTGNNYNSGNQTNVNLTLTNDAVLAWLWQTQALFNASATNGIITGAANGWYSLGTNIVVTNIPNTNYHLSGWFGDTNGCTANGNELIVPMGIPRTIIASNDINRYSLNVNSAHGMAWPGTLTNMVHGTNLNQFITNSPVVDGSLRYLINGGNVLSNDFSQNNLTNISLNLTNNALLNWLWNTQALFNASATNGNVSGASNGWYGLGSNIIVTATPSGNYHFSRWLGNVPAGSVSNNPLTLTMDQGRSISPLFEANIALYNLTVNSAHNGTWPGTTNNVAHGTTLDQFIINSPVSIETGLRAVANGGNVSGNDYIQNNSTNISLTLTNNAVLNWMWKTQALFSASSQNGTISGAANGWYDLQTILSLTALPNSNYRFSRWTGDVPVGSISNNPLSLVMDQGRNIGAVFDSETLSAPTGVLASDGTFTSLVAVAWDTVAGAGAYEVWRNSANNAAGAVFLNNVSVTNYTDAADAVRYGTLWYYWVRAVNTNTVTSSEFSVGDSGYAQVSATNAFITGQPVVGDYDGDGLADPALYDLSSGQLYVWLSLMGYARVAPMMSFRIAAGDLPVAGDFDGDRLTDPGVFQRDTGSWFIWLSSAGYARVGPVLFGLDANDIPVPSDFDGDGKTDPAVYHAADGSWTVWLSEFGYSKAGPITFQAGLTDIPAPGRYEGGTLADPAVYQPGTGDWYVWLAGAGYGRFGPLSFPTTDAHVVVPADYDGDGLCDPAAYIPATGTWRIWYSSSGYHLTEVELR